MTKAKATTKKTEAVALAPEASDSSALTTPGMRRMSEADIKAMATSDGVRLVPKLQPLSEPGDSITGKLVGKGPDFDFEDKFTKENKPIGTWEFEVAAGIVIRIFSSYQLAKDLAGHEGKRVTVVRGAQKDAGQVRVNQYIVAIHD